MIDPKDMPTAAIYAEKDAMLDRTNALNAELKRRRDVEEAFRSGFNIESLTCDGFAPCSHPNFVWEFNDYRVSEKQE